MANFCIPKNIVEKISKQIDNESVEKLFNMTKDERISFFSKHANSSLASNISNKFDDILAESKRSSLEFAMKKLGLSKKEAAILRKEIRKLTNDELLNPEIEDGIIEKLTASSIGANITEEETKKIVALGAEIEKYRSIVDVTKPLKDGKFSSKYGDAFINMAEKQNELDKFLISRIPISKSDTFWSHAKASMLLKPASWLVNIVSNIENTGLEAISRRAGNAKLGGYNSQIAKDWKKMMATIYKKTGNDYSRALSMDDLITGKGKTLGEISNVGKNTWFTNMIYKNALGSPDAWSARMNFADEANLLSSRMADQMGLKGGEAKQKAAEIMTDAFNVNPTTEAGKIVRESAVADAMRATYTNKSVSSKTAEDFRRVINAIPVVKQVRGGDLVEPFVKTPANVIEQGMDVSGLGFLKSAVKFIKYSSLKNIDEQLAKKYLSGSIKDSAKAGTGLAVSYLIADFIGEDNFMGAYDPRRSKWEQLRNSNYNAIRIGDRWISLDYLGPLGSPVVAMLYAKKYGDGGANTAGEYMKGVASQILRLPFVKSSYDFIGGYQEMSSVGEDKFIKNSTKLFMEQVAARIPGLFADIAKMSSTEIRDTSTAKYNVLGINLDPIVAKLPWVANNLPGKRNMIGEEIKTEQYSNDKNFAIGLMTNLLAGARVKTEQQSPEGKEIYRLSEAGAPPTITNWKYPSSKRLVELRDKLGEDKYQEVFIDEFGKEFKKVVSDIINDSDYKEADDEDKKKLIDSAEDEIMENIYFKYDIE